MQAYRVLASQDGIVQRELINIREKEREGEDYFGTTGSLVTPPPPEILKNLFDKLTFTVFSLKCLKRGLKTRFSQKFRLQCSSSASGDHQGVTPSLPCGP